MTVDQMEDPEFLNAYVQTNKDKESRAIAKIGDLLLKGWVLLDATCPKDGCYGTLVCQKGNRSTPICVLCEENDKKDSEPVSKPLSTITQDISREQALNMLFSGEDTIQDYFKQIKLDSNRPESNDSAHDMSIENGNVSDAGSDNLDVILDRVADSENQKSNTNESFQTYEKQRDEACSKLGQYLLKGFIMTDTPCPKCVSIPLVKDPKSASQLCVSCDFVDSPKVESPQKAKDDDSIVQTTKIALYNKLEILKQEMSSTDPTDTTKIIEISEAICKIGLALKSI